MFILVNFSRNPSEDLELQVTGLAWVAAEAVKHKRSFTGIKTGCKYKQINEIYPDSKGSESLVSTELTIRNSSISRDSKREDVLHGAHLILTILMLSQFFISQ